MHAATAAGGARRGTVKRHMLEAQNVAAVQRCQRIQNNNTLRTEGRRFGRTKQADSSERKSGQEKRQHSANECSNNRQAYERIGHTGVQRGSCQAHMSPRVIRLVRDTIKQRGRGVWTMHSFGS